LELNPKSSYAVTALCLIKHRSNFVVLYPQNSDRSR